MQIACFDSQLTNNWMQISPLDEGMTRRFCICIELLRREIFYAPIRVGHFVLHLSTMAL